MQGQVIQRTEKFSVVFSVSLVSFICLSPVSHTHTTTWQSLSPLKNREKQDEDSHPFSLCLSLPTGFVSVGRQAQSENSLFLSLSRSPNRVCFCRQAGTIRGRLLSLSLFLFSFSLCLFLCFSLSLALSFSTGFVSVRADTSHNRRTLSFSLSLSHSHSLSFLSVSLPLCLCLCLCLCLSLCPCKDR